MDTHDLHLPDNHQAILDRFIMACQADDRILAAFLGGSYACSEADQFSDLDLFFVTTDEAYEDFLREKEIFARRLGEPLFLEDFGVQHGCLFIMSNAAEGEFWFGRASKFKNIYSGPIKVLLDKKNILVGESFPLPSAELASQVELLRKQIAWFWHDLFHFIKAMGRRQLWFAYGELNVLRQMCVILARLKYNFTDAYLAEDEPHFKIENALPVEVLTPLQTTFCPLDYDAMLQAAQVVFQFYLDTAPGLAEAHQLPYPLALERIMMRKLQDLKKG